MFRDLLQQAAASLRHNRRRSALTMLGMAWGIATVVMLLAYGDGFERGLNVAFTSFGSHMIGIFPGRTSLQAGGSKAGEEIRLTLDDVDWVSAEVPAIQRISPYAEKRSSVGFGTRAAVATAAGSYPVYYRIRSMELADGRFPNEEDEIGRNRVVVLGADVKKKVFSGQNAVGETVRIDGISFQVVGVLRYRIQDGDQNENDQIFVPFSAMGDLRNTRYLDGIFLEYEGAQDGKVAAAVRNSMAYHHTFDPKDKRAVFIFDVAEELEEIAVITTGIKVLLGFIGLLTLGIGGVGLMNIMLVSVTHRTREIGVEKALGARKRHILLQFLAEALAITFAGGVLGIVMAYAVSWVVGPLTLWSAFFEGTTEGDIHLRIDAATLLWATGILCLVGIVSGMLPAIKAARLDPIEALRYE